MAVKYLSYVDHLPHRRPEEGNLEIDNQNVGVKLLLRLDLQYPYL